MDNISKVSKTCQNGNDDELPDKFVLKVNHASGMNIICKDKLNFDINMAKNKLKKWKNINYGLLRTEFQYFSVNRKIFVAPYLGDKLIEYQIFCFNNEPKFIRAHKHLFEYNHTVLHNYYNSDWKLTDIESGLKHYYRIPEIKIKKPKNFNLMIDYCKKLSDKFTFVRIDFYEISLLILYSMFNSYLLFIYLDLDISFSKIIFLLWR